MCFDVFEEKIMATTTYDKAKIYVNGVELDVVDGIVISTDDYGIELASGPQLDYLGELSNVHRDWTLEENKLVSETDADYRQRILEKVRAKTCSHDWTTYDSGWTRYDYCKHCDVKRD